MHCDKNTDKTVDRSDITKCAYCLNIILALGSVPCMKNVYSTEVPVLQKLVCMVIYFVYFQVLLISQENSTVYVLSRAMYVVT
jgi:hypothetical protein